MAAAESDLIGKEAVYQQAVADGPANLPQVLATGAEQVVAVELITRGLVEGAEEPSTLYNERSDKLPPELDSVTLSIESGDPDVLAARAERGRIIGEGGNRTRRRIGVIRRTLRQA